MTEYWPVDPDVRRAESCQLDPSGSYHLMAPDASGAYHSAALPGFWLRAEWLWDDPLPEVEATLLQVAGENYARYLIRQLRGTGYLGDEGGADRCEMPPARDRARRVTVPAA